MNSLYPRGRIVYLTVFLGVSVFSVCGLPIGFGHTHSKEDIVTMAALFLDLDSKIMMKDESICLKSRFGTHRK